MSFTDVIGGGVAFDLRLTLSILIVTDGAINLWDTPLEPSSSKNNEGFTLREMARALWDPPANLYPYTVFVVDHAIHGTGNTTQKPRVETDPSTNKTRRWTEYNAFRFDSSSATLKNYDQVWFFGYWPGNPTNGQYSTPSNRVQLSPSELKVLTNFMKAGGGVFATGDHGLLGQHLCGDIPRVSKMRRWADRGISDMTPSVGGPDRIDTLVPVRAIDGQLGVNFEDQSDNFPKPLQLKRYFLWDGLHISKAAFPTTVERARWMAHPVLCSPLGPIDVLPDHMHEGLVREDDEVALDGTDPNGAKEFPGGADRPKPEVIAWSTVRGGKVVYDDQGDATSVGARVVPTISVYDGEPAKVGRVVVDSTFHNWLDINLRATGAGLRVDPQTGLLEQATGLLGKNLELVHFYIRNIAQWLATPSQRAWMRNGLFLHTVANTGGWPGLVNVGVLLGQHAANVLGQITSECERFGFAFEPWWYSKALGDLRKENTGKMTLPPKEFVYYHVFGSMVETIFDLIPKLPRRKSEERRNDNSVKEFELITSRLDSARQAGVLAMAADWRTSLDKSAQFLDLVERIVTGDWEPQLPKAQPTKKLPKPQPTKKH